MKKGRIKVGISLLKDSLQLPIEWDIEGISYNQCDPHATFVISGPDFPEVTNVEGAEIKDCMVIFHKEAVRVEVKEL